VLQREIGGHWDSASDRLSYAMPGLQVVICVSALIFSNVGDGLDESGSRSFGVMAMAASAVVVMMAVYFIAMRWRKKSAVAPAP